MNKNPKLYKLYADFVNESIPLLKESIANCDEFSTLYFKKHKKYPRVKFRENGMPDIDDYGESLLNVGSFFTWIKNDRDKDKILLSEIKSVSILFDYLFNLQEYRELYFNFDHLATKEFEGILQTLTRADILSLLERYYHLSNNNNIGKDILHEVYDPFEKYLYSKKIHFDLAAPILFTHFEEEYFSINDSVYVREIDEESQKARISKTRYSPSICSALVSSATHEVVFKNYNANRPNKIGVTFFSEESVYPIDKFNLFFNALKISTGIDTGYAQILVYPDNWADSYYQDIKVMDGTSVRQYPEFFENFYWNTKKLPVVTKDQLIKIATLFNKLTETSENKILIASKRLRSSYLRSVEEDSIIDIIIALETLLSNNERTEITHKLSMRLAKLLHIFSKENPIEVFDSMKKIYAYRSAIVHGSSKLNSKKEIKLSDKKPIKTIQLANSYLTKCLDILILNPKYLDSKEIDKLILTQ